MSRRNVALMTLAALALLGGCVEREVHIHTRPMPAFGESDPDMRRVTREEPLRARVEKDPKDVQGWFELGEYYESGLDLVKAIGAYEKGNSLLEPGRYTGGHYLLAKCFLRLQDWDRSIGNLNAIFALEPKDPKSACLNSHFREAHYLRGVIYFVNKQPKPAKHEFLRYLEIGGEEWRVEDSLAEIQAQGE